MKILRIIANCESPRTGLTKKGAYFLIILLMACPAVFGMNNTKVNYQPDLPARTLRFPVERWAPAQVYLMTMDIKGSQRIYKAALRDLGPARGRVYVHAGGAAGLVITMEGAEKLSSLKELRPDDIQYIRAHSVPLQSSDLNYIKHLSGLQQFDSALTNLDDEAILVISHFKNLETLMLKHCNITDKYLELLSKMPKLKNVFLEYCQVTDNGIKKLAGNKSIVTLGLEGSKVTENCIPYLIQMKKLENIRIPGVSLNDEELMRLSVLKSLWNIQIGPRKITKVGIARFNAKLPNCSVSRYKFKFPLEMLF